jgi:hypothetical protein
MQTRLPFAVLTLCSLLTGVGNLAATEMPLPELKPVLAKVQAVVEKHYPKATVIVKDETIHFEFNSRKFMIHEPVRTGDWQDAHEESGPREGGIYGDIELRAGEYGGMAAVPQTFDKLYFKLLLMAPYSKKLDRHLYIRLKYPREVPKELIKDFEFLLGELDKQFPERLALKERLELSIADDQRPKITATEALRIAEKFVKEEKIDVSRSFIAKVRYVDWKVAKHSREPYWEVCYEPVARLTMGGEIWVSVAMDGKCSHEFGK